MTGVQTCALPIYVNGVLDGSNATTANFDLSGGRGPQYIGVCLNDVPGVYNVFDGYIEQLKVYNTSLSNEQIIMNFNANRGRYGL